MDALGSLRSVATAYSNLESLEADALLISHQEDDGFKQHSEQLVRVAYCRPNKIRIEQSHRNGQTIVSDGDHLHSYFRAPKRYFKSELQHLPGVFRPEFFYASDTVVLYERIAERVASAELRSTGVIPVNGAETLCNMVSVTYEPPIHGGFVKAASPILFWFDMATNLVLRSEVDITLDPPQGIGAHTVKQSIVLTRLALNVPLAPATFEFLAPPDAEGELCGVSGRSANRFKDPRHGIERQSSHVWEGEIYVERDKWKFKGHELAFERRWEMLGDKELAISERISGPKGDIDRSISIPLGDCERLWKSHKRAAGPGNAHKASTKVANCYEKRGCRVATLLNGGRSMAKEHLRDRILGGTAEEAVKRRTEEGWRLVAIEWERDVPNGAISEDKQHEPVPFGFRIANDCRHLESDPVELEILALVTEMIVRERPLPAISDALNSKGYRTRDGRHWTPSAVFELMPRIIESGPRIFDTPNWRERRSAARP